MTEHLPQLDFDSLTTTIERINELKVELEAEYAKLGHRVRIEVVPTQLTNVKEDD